MAGMTAYDMVERYTVNSQCSTAVDVTTGSCWPSSYWRWSAGGYQLRRRLVRAQRQRVGFVYVPTPTQPEKEATRLKI